MSQPNVLYVMTDQQRFDTIAGLGNQHIYTPNFDRLAKRGVVFTNAYSTCPVCIPARYTIRTGCEPPGIAVWSNHISPPKPGQPAGMEDRCGTYLGRAMSEAGYRTFGIGKFHTAPWDEDVGFQTHLHAEAGYGLDDAYGSFIIKEHPEFSFVEDVHGEKTDMYYMPQMRCLPADLAVEAWAADRAVEQIHLGDDRPYFGFVSFLGPHPPFAPPVPFNRMYDPDRLPGPVCGERSVDHMDEQIPWMNHSVWADDINDLHARVLKARYYGTITYIDQCLGRILDAVEERDDAENTLICFFSDHGDMLGDHYGWQKECFFEASARVPFLLSWPSMLPQDQRNGELVCLTDLFGIATTAAGKSELRDGIDVLGMLAGEREPRSSLVGYHELPGEPYFKTMVRQGDWKLIFMANGGLVQLFNVRNDPDELSEVSREHSDIVDSLSAVAVDALREAGYDEALEGGKLRGFEFRHREPARICQFSHLHGVKGFPEHPSDVLKG